jgi:Rrf2 family nitric oxide-sensitive transcriptional repressor
MRLLASTDIALRVLMLLAARPGCHLSVEALSRELGGLSRNHMHKIVQELSALGVVRTIRGAGGGVALAGEPKRIRLGWLIRELEADQPIVECFRADGGGCTLTPGCRLRCMVTGARDAFYASLDTHTLADCLPLPVI